MSVAEYAKIRNCSRKNVYNILYRNALPMGVISKKLSGKSYILFVDKEQVERLPKKRINNF